MTAVSILFLGSLSRTCDGKNKVHMILEKTARILSGEYRIVLFLFCVFMVHVAGRSIDFKIGRGQKSPSMR
jgi:hypothetical protein